MSTLATKEVRHPGEGANLMLILDSSENWDDKTDLFQSYRMRVG